MSTTNDQAAPVQSPADAAGPGVADYAGVIEELRRLRDEAEALYQQSALGEQQALRASYHNGRAVAYGRCLRLLSSEDKPEPISPLAEPAKPQDKKQTRQEP